METTFREVKESKFSAKRIMIIAVIVLLLGAVGTCFKIVPAGSTGVVVTLGKVSDSVLSEGLHFKAPVVQDIEIISNKIEKQEVDAEAVSKDLQAISSKIAVNYRVALDSSAKIFKNIGRNYAEVVLLPAVQESMKSVSAKYTAEDLIAKRAQVSTEIKETLESKVTEYGISIEKLNIINFDFSAEFNSAIEAKQIAEQNLLKTKTEQEQQIVIAEAEAKKKVIAAQAEADAITAKANAQSKANQQLSKSLSDTLVEYEKVQKWDGKLPTVNGGSAIVDIGSITGTEESN